MDWFDRLFTSVAYGLGALLSAGLSSAGEKAGDSLQVGRPLDKFATARRMSRDQTELYDLYKRLWRYEAQAEGIFSEFCWGAVNIRHTPRRRLPTVDRKRNRQRTSRPNRRCGHRLKIGAVIGPR